MMHSSREDKLRQAVLIGNQRLSAIGQQTATRTGPPAPGDLFIFPGLSKLALEWLIVQTNREQTDQFFLVPVDDFPLTGPADVPLSEVMVHRPMTARCDQGTWVPASFLRSEYLAGVLPFEALHQVRLGVANLVQGKLDSDPEREEAENDPTYENWMVRVERARLRLEKQLAQTELILPFDSFRSGLPEHLAAEPPSAMATHSASQLHQALSDALGQADSELRCQNIPWPGQGKLLALASLQGVWILWEGNESERPPIKVQIADGQRGRVEWEPTTGPRTLFVSRAVIPWLQGRVVLRIGKKQPLQVTIAR